MPPLQMKFMESSVYPEENSQYIMLARENGALAKGCPCPLPPNCSLLSSKARLLNFRSLSKNV